MITMLSAALCLSQNIQAQEADPFFELKAVLISKLVGFTDWPVTKPDNPILAKKDSDQKSGSNARVFNFCTLKNAELADQFAHLYHKNGIKIKSKEIKVKNLSSLAQAEQCELIYLRQPSPKDFSSLVQLRKEKAILLIGELNDAAPLGLHFNLYEEQGQIKFEIFVESMQFSGFKPQYILLNYGKVVSGGQS